MLSSFCCTPRAGQEYDFNGLIIALSDPENNIYVVQRSMILLSNNLFSTEAMSFLVLITTSGVTETEVVPALTIISVISG